MARHARTTALVALLLLDAAALGFVMPGSSIQARQRTPSRTTTPSDKRQGMELKMTAVLDPSALPIFGTPMDVEHLRGGMQLHQPIQEVPVVSKQVLLIASAVLSYMFVAAIAPVGLMALFENGIFLPFLQNLTPAAVCFGGADVVTQLVTAREEQKKAGGLGFPLRVDAWRSASAAGTGIICNAIGLTVWLHFLNTCLPAARVGLEGGKFGLLLAKTMTHAFVWGTLSNSLSLVMRRMLAGDSPSKSVSFWNSKILKVTKTNFLFWPAWMLFNFALVPQHYQVRVTAVGAFCFNIFMSYVSQQKAAPPPPVLRVNALPEHPVTPTPDSPHQTKWLDDEVFSLNDVILASTGARGVEGILVPVEVDVPTSENKIV